jgi:lipopolysaccharide/colanic/teichoic acid biosynthesis glycosyltransferase
MKRLFDIAASALGILLLSPVFLFFGLAVRLSGPGPVLFRQERVGLHGRVFRIAKFRSMVQDAERRGGKLTVGGDSRITPLGRFIRRHKIDELPQLFNVLRGDMSLVGPRPEVVELVHKYEDAYRPLLSVRPGITHRVTLMFRNEEEMLAGTSNPIKLYENNVMPTKIRLYTHFCPTCQAPIFSRKPRPSVRVRPSWKRRCRPSAR